MKINLSQIEEAELLQWKEQIEAELRIREKRSQPVLVIEAMKNEKRALNYIRRYCSGKKIDLKKMTMADLARLTFKQIIMGDSKISRIRINKVLADHGYDPIN